ncbi:hypothetical protein EXIGLDRAFT_299220 [Exidia glandulosa HHB12029]|uniref:Uncharacterized protein n=1 Tax=Exidia glandulosa HHB12029 TaxID=1314781 RepID=A0A165DA17_EXIGL|nr:hypothetical protein EXIGLDRAFT_299220 [Exidia glandulosa HHB12029]
MSGTSRRRRILTGADNGLWDRYIEQYRALLRAPEGAGVERKDRELYEAANLEHDLDASMAPPDEATYFAYVHSEGAADDATYKDWVESGTRVWK